MKIKIENYTILVTQSILNENLKKIASSFDKNENDKNDTYILNEVYNNKVDILLTEDKKIFKKAKELKIDYKVYTIDKFLEKLINENPDLKSYKVLPIVKKQFGYIDINDSFFDTLKEDYNGFERWFDRKTNEIAYIYEDEQIKAFLY